MPATKDAARGRPRAFDQEVVLERAMRVFWEHGYEGASMAQLVEAMGINSPSIYRAFGDKSRLFEAAVAHYARTTGALTPQTLASPLTARAAIETLLKANVAALTEPGRPQGCLIVLGAIKGGPDQDGARAFLARHRGEIHRALQARLTRAIAEGELAADVDVESLAAVYVTFLNGLSIQAVDGTPRSVLLKAVDRLLATWPGQPNP